MPVIPKHCQVAMLPGVARAVPAALVDPGRAVAGLLGLFPFGNPLPRAANIFNVLSCLKDSN
jgi:hypothetical protein